MEARSILVGADVPPDPDAGASGTVFQMNAALRRLGHQVDEIWASDLAHRIRHGNLHYLFELPRAYRRAMRASALATEYDVIELNQPHAYLAAQDHRRRRRHSVFVNRSHGHEVRSEESLERWRRAIEVRPKPLLRRIASHCIRRLLDRQWDKIARTADGFHVSCREDRDFLAERYGVAAERIGLVSQGIPKAFIETAPRPLDNGRMARLLYVGQFAFFKAPMMVARAAERLLLDRQDMTMTWVCSCTHHAEVRRLFQEDPGGRLRLLDWMPQDDLVRVYDEHGFFLFLSFFEGFGKTPLEAMARGLCVVASETGGMRDFIQHGRTGMLVAVGEPNMAAECVLELLQDPARCRTMSAAAREAATQHTWDRCARDVTEFYEHLLRRKAEQER